MLKKFETWRPEGLAALRIVTALLFFEHGTMKAFGFPTGKPIVFGADPLMSAQLVLELAGGALMALGLWTRPLAFLLCGNMAVAYFYAHAPRSFYPAVNGGEPTILFCFIFLYICLAGPGRWSLDGLRRRA